MKLSYHIILIFLFSGLKLFGQEVNQNLNDLSFKHLSSNEGLSQRSISDILQDHKGYLWFGTRDGLNKYDGDRIIVYRHKSDDTTSLTHSWIKCLFEDTNNNIWIGTKEGLNKYNPSEDVFSQYTYNRMTKGLSDNEIWSIAQLNANLLVVATNKGLNFIEMCNENINAHEFGLAHLKNTFLDKKIRNVLVTRNGDLCICTVDAIYNYNKKTEKIITLQYPKHAIKDSYLNNEPILFEDAKGQIWLGYDKGLAMLNQASYGLSDYTVNGKKLLSSAVRTICEDSYGNLWIGTYSGLFILNTITQKFYCVQNNKNNPKSLSHNSIYKILKDTKGDMWIGTWQEGGVILMTFKGPQFFWHLRPVIL